MNHKSMFFGALTAAALAASAPHAGAATYSDTYTVDPSTFTCASVGAGHACYAVEPFSSPRLLSVGDVLTETFTYTAPVVVPASAKYSLAFVDLYNADSTFVLHPGAYNAGLTQTLAGYSGPSGLTLLNYTSLGYAGGYYAFAGFCCGHGPNPGFTFTGETTTYTIAGAGPLPVNGVFAGYAWSTAVPEPASWVMMLAGVFGLGAVLRGARSQRADPAI